MPPRRRPDRINRGRLADDQHRLSRKKTRRGFGECAAHHREIGRDMDIGEALQLWSGAPVWERVERKMDHHCAGASANARDLLVEGLTLRVRVDKPAEYDLRMKVC